MMNSQRIEVYDKNLNLKGLDLLSGCLVKTGNVYLVSGYKQGTLSRQELEVFYDDVGQHVFTGEHDPCAYDFALEVFYRPGVTDNTARSAIEALRIFGGDYFVNTGHVYFYKGSDCKEDILDFANKNLLNPLIQNVNIYPVNDAKWAKRFCDVRPIRVSLEDVTNESLVKLIDLQMSENDFNELNKSRCLALTFKEFSLIAKHFLNTNKKRVLEGMPAQITDVELEIIAQTWSEHCSHKIFKANIDYKENPNITNKQLGQFRVNGLFKQYIKKATDDVIKHQNIKWCQSLFTDNAGIVRFDDSIDHCIKVETHNSPSALDPYGGALTGILGVNRDILGCGLGARPIANSDVFCFPPLDIEDETKLPKGPMPPKRILKGVHKGVEDGGNKSGVPTVNGSMFFHDSYLAKPLVYVGTVGVMPQENKDGVKTSTKEILSGDQIIVAGGAVGADGIHGATFSSIHLDETAPATAVQIGDPLTQKKVMEFLIEARDLNLFRCVTDNGAGGISSSVGEMATLCGGATIHLDQCHFKYPGLLPYEIMISESQERMSFAVPGEKVDEFISLAQIHGVDCSHIGEFNNSGNLEVFYKKEKVAVLDLDFLHEGNEPMELTAFWDGPLDYKYYLPKTLERLPRVLGHNFYGQALKKLLSDKNICSKEAYVRRYDHEVKGATIVKPFASNKGSSPNNGGVIWNYPYGGQKDLGVVLGHGLAPKISSFDPYLMAKLSVDEAVRNVVSVGGDPDHLCLLDNFCWPDPIRSKKNPQGDYQLASLVRCCVGLYDICTNYGLPLVSGKDSMKNNFVGKNQQDEDIALGVLPTLLVTAMAQVKVEHVCTSEFKRPGDVIYLLGSRLGESTYGLYGSAFSDHFDLQTNGAIKSYNKISDVAFDKNINLYRSIYQSHQKNILESCHDISEGGMLVGLTESCFTHEFGVELNLRHHLYDYALLEQLFNESPGRFIVSVSPNRQVEFENHFKDLAFEKIGLVSSEPRIIVKNNDGLVLDESIKSCFASWNGGLL